METEIQRFYKSKTVFLTGGTGFFGKVFIEKLLRSTEVSRIYMLIRNKRGQSLEERINSWKKDPAFKVLLESKPNVFDRVTPIGGDCLEPDLGINEEDRKTLFKNVQIVIHSAATVRFDEKLHVALTINTQGTRLMLKLAKTMPQLVAFLHISTAFSNCVQTYTEEKFYPENLTCSAGNVLNLSQQISDELLDKMEPVLMGKYPNNYTYSKALAENLILEESGPLPLAILRPTFIMPTYKEPVRGYIDNFYGPIGFVYGVGMGVLRLALHDVTKPTSITPMDYCVNLALATIWQTARLPTSAVPQIYNLAPSESNVVTSGQYNDFVRKHGYTYPSTKMIWYPFCHSIATPWLFQLVAFFYHTIPGYIFDFLLLLMGRKPRLTNIYRKIHATMISLHLFLSTNWRFNSKNTSQLWSSMSVEDQNLYNFDLTSIDWEDFTDISLRGIRLYLAKEPLTADSLQKSQRLLSRLFLMHQLLLIFLCCVGGYILWFLFSQF